MDGLALLCNLHADGPLSLRRLRDSGIRALDDLGGVSEETLAATLRASPSQVRRFQHEGRLLSRRLKELPLESEFTEDAPIPGEVRARLLRRIVRPPVAYDTNPPASLHAHEAEPEAAAEPATVLGETEPTLFDEGPAEPPAPPETGTPRLAAVFQEGTPLKIGEIRGLDSRTCQRLVAQGVRTYRALVDLANLNLARRTGIPFTRLLDLRHHARRFLEERLMPAGDLPLRTAAPVASIPEKPPLAAEVERIVEIEPRPRRVPEPPRALRMERVPEASPAPVSAPSEPDAHRESVRPDDPGVAGPFV